MNIFQASKRGDVGRIEELVRSGTSVDSRDANFLNRTPLMWAAAYNQQEAAKFLYENGCNLNLQDSGGNTAVHWAAYLEYGALVKMLADWGADLEIRNSDGQTPVNKVAAARGRADMVRILGNLGANLQSVDDNGQSPKENALNGGHMKTLEVLEELQKSTR